MVRMYCYGKKDQMRCVPVAANAAGPTSSTISPTTARPPSTSLAATSTPPEGVAGEAAEAPDAISAISAASTVSGWLKKRLAVAGSEGFRVQIQRYTWKIFLNIY